MNELTQQYRLHTEPDDEEKRNEDFRLNLNKETK
jgi:hypothetical protein